MLFIWGKKEVRRRLGYVADFCPMCRELRAFELWRIGLVGHVYYISFGEGDLAGHQRRCMTCRIDLDAKAEIYQRPHDEPLDVRRLIPLTFPNVATYRAARFALEKAIRDPFGKVSAEDRMALIREPFTLIAHRAEARFESSFIDSQSCMAFLASLVVGGFIGAGLVGLNPELELHIWIGVLIAVLIATAVWSAWLRRRFVRKDLLPPLVAALRPLKPTLEELRAVLKDLKKLGLKIGGRVKPAVLLEMLKAT